MINKTKPVYQKANRILYHLKSDKPTKTIVFFAGIHGNEKAGVYALNNVFNNFKQHLKDGEIYGVLGNIKALEKNKRYLSCDLNRMWTSKKLQHIQQSTTLNNEEQEQWELYEFLNTLFRKTKHAIYFLDLHTTSSKTLPFITVNDALINRTFSKRFPMPIVLGIEEYLHGPLLSYLNTLGYVSIGFEAGQHTDPKAVKLFEAFIYLVMHYTKVSPLTIIKQKYYESQLKEASNYNTSIFEIVYRYAIKKDENFKMLQGFKSFQNIKKGTQIAISNQNNVKASKTGQLFMPLYQKSGNDGFFIIKPIPKFILKVSHWFRKLKLDNALTVLPGITWHNKKEGVLKANLRIARFLTKSIFHLLGYRNKQINRNFMLLYNRERVSKTHLYSNFTYNKPI